MTYRPEIDGLRGIAIILVVLFHANFSVFRGGYIGVDVFFVISGYLITTIILDDIDSGNFSFKYFYERRIRRLLPALFCVCIVSSIFAWLYLDTVNLQNFGSSLSAASLFYSNFFFWQDINYFSHGTAPRPLLHTWSLAIEEQFYIILPAILALLYKTGKPRVKLKHLVFFGLALSLLLSVWARTRYSSANFYTLPTRAWELGAGVMVALLIREQKLSKTISARSSNLHGIISGLGLVLLLCGILLAAETRKFPDFAVLPVLGTCLLIVFTPESRFCKGLLSNKLLVHLGLISYSFYLWHYSIFVLAREYFLQSIDLAGYLTLIIGAYVISVLSWRHIETPFRHKNFLSQKKIYQLAVFITLVLFILGWLFANGKIKPRVNLPEKLQSAFVIVDDISCLKRVQQNRYWHCDINMNKHESDIDLLVLGDSHALSYYPVLKDLAELNKLRIVMKGGLACPPLISNLDTLSDLGVRDKRCLELNKEAANLLKQGVVEKVLWIGRWSLYQGDHYSETTTGVIEQPNRSSAFSKALENTMGFYDKHNIDLSVFSQVPSQKAHPARLYNHIYRKKAEVDRNRILEENSVSFEDFSELQKNSLDVFSEYSAKISFVRLDEHFCKMKCLVGTTDVSYYFDDDHLSSAGAFLLKDVLGDIVNE